MRKCLAPIFILGPLFRGAARRCDGTSPSRTGGALGSNSVAATDALSDPDKSLLSEPGVYVVDHGSEPGALLTLTSCGSNLHLSVPT